jgi:hypothetical protein
MLLPYKPQTNAERQRRFQDAHPGYDRRRKAQARALEKSMAAARHAAILEQFAKAQATTPQTPATPAPELALPEPASRPLLPAPMELPAAIETLPASALPAEAA